MVKSKLMFAVHASSRFGRTVGALSLGAWPLAMSDRVYSGPPESYEDISGFWALWEAVASVEDFGMCAFGGGDLDGPKCDETGWRGIWVYEVTWSSEDVSPDCNDCCDPEAWYHLHHGTFRRPTPDELSAVTGGHSQDWQVVL